MNESTHPESPYADLAERLTRAIRHLYEKIDGAYFDRATQETFGTSSTLLATVTFDRVTIDPADGGGLKAFRVVPNAGLDRKQAALWRRKVESWSAKSEAWIVVSLTDGDIKLKRRLSLYELRKMVGEFLSPEEVDELPLTFAAPVQPTHDLSLWGLRLIATKVLKRQGGEVKIPVARDLVTALPGWSWHEGMVARLLRNDHYDDARDLGRLLAPHGLDVYFRQGAGHYIYRRDAHVSDDDVAVVRHAVSVVNGTLPDDHPLPNAERGQFLVSGLRVENNTYFHTAGRKLIVVENVWRATFARVVTAPNGERHALYQHKPYKPHGRAPEVSYDERFWVWAYRSCLGEMAEGVLAAADPVMLQRALTGKVTDLVNTGQCQFCERIQKLDRRGEQPVMVDHGYHYPHSEGFRGGLLGTRVGPCRGVGWRPYELAHDLLDIYIVELRAIESRERSTLATLRNRLSQRIEPIGVMTRWLDSKHVDADRHNPDMTSIGPSHPVWEKAMHIAIGDQEADLRSLVRQIQSVQRRIDTWVLRPLYAPAEEIGG